MADKKDSRAGKKTKSKGAQTVAKTTAVSLAVAGLLLGWVVGYVVASSTDDDSDTGTSESHSSHEHETLEVAVADAPTIEVLADADKKGGWNITLVTENFMFTPEDVNEADEVGTGHAHIYVDGEKMGRVYGNHYHLGALGEGDHDIRVTLNTNGHKDYAVNGEVVEATVTVTETAASEKDGHSHGSDDHDHGHSDDDDHGHDHME